MRPPAEQLIRDYLNRLSVAARTRLPPDDRRAFLARTRDFIERQSGARETADPAVVMRILSGIGEPEAAVEREAARLEALRGERAAAAARSGLWKSRARTSASGQGHQGSENGAEPAAEPRGAPRPPRAASRPFTGEITITSRPISARWKPGASLKRRQARPHRIPRPRRGGSRPPEGNGAAPGAGAGQPPGTAALGPPGAAALGPSGAAAPGPSGAAAGRAGAAPGPTAGGPAARQPGGAPAAGPRGAANGQAPQRGAVTGAGPSPPAQPPTVVPRPAPSPAHLTTARQRRLQLAQPTNITRGIATGIADAWRRHRREVIAVALLAIAGLIFPSPIWFVGPLLWLIGAGIALSSRLWSKLDKWVAVPGLVVLVIVGTVIAVSLGGARSHAAAYGDEAMTDAATLFRVGALLGAVYLAWRTHRGRRPPAVPPWVRRRA